MGQKIVNENLESVTLLVDIDGVLVKHYVDADGRGVVDQPLRNVEILPGVWDKFKEWKELGYKIILITARHESFREITESQLQSMGLQWEQLIMGIGSGRRYLINDMKTNTIVPTAVAINVQRNYGLQDVDLESYFKCQEIAFSMINQNQS